MPTLEEAHQGHVLRLVRVEDQKLAESLKRIGLAPGSTFVKFPKEEIVRRSVRVRGPERDAVLGGGMCAKIIVQKADGGKMPLSQMNRNEEGAIEALGGGAGLIDTLETLGFRVGERIQLLRKLPPMEYVAGMDRKKHVHLQEGIASKIWGVMEGRECQFTSAKVRKEFRVKKLLGGARARKYLTGLGVKPGTTLALVGIEQGKPIAYGPGDHLAIETMDGLRIHFGPVEAHAIQVEAIK